MPLHWFGLSFHLDFPILLENPRKIKKPFLFLRGIIKSQHDGSNGENDFLRQVIKCDRENIFFQIESIQNFNLL